MSHQVIVMTRWLYVVDPQEEWQRGSAGYLGELTVSERMHTL